MSDATSKGEACVGCDNYLQLWHVYPCDACTRGGSGRQTDHYKTFGIFTDSKPAPKQNGNIVVKPAGSGSKSQELAAAHWRYVEEVLRQAYKEDSKTVEAYIAEIGFHYRSALIHGYKHAMEEKCK